MPALPHAAPRFRMPLSYAAWRFRTRTHHHPHHASRQSQPPSAHSHSHSHFAVRSSQFAFAFRHHPHAHLRAAQHATSPTTAALLLLASADRFSHRNQPNSQPQVCSTQRTPPITIIITQTTHIGTATHMPPAVPLRHRCCTAVWHGHSAGHAGMVRRKCGERTASGGRCSQRQQRQQAPGRWCLH